MTIQVIVDEHVVKYFCDAVKLDRTLMAYGLCVKIETMLSELGFDRLSMSVLPVKREISN